MALHYQLIKYIANSPAQGRGVGTRWSFQPKPLCEPTFLWFEWNPYKFWQHSTRPVITEPSFAMSYLYMWSTRFSHETMHISNRKSKILRFPLCFWIIHAGFAARSALLAPQIQCVPTSSPFLLCFTWARGFTGEVSRVVAVVSCVDRWQETHCSRLCCLEFLSS